ncbi:NAD-dependent epimerase/dehydratase family protein [Rathayibacter sp. YIM 133350]|uniref:NAD-dependent epimerase/dehydratase family protein n=1 Tax=Rathayibacter sp. YIM 133350 TaxID=3131992 RepID=UPI00307DDAB5
MGEQRRAFIIGGTGQIGSAAARRLISDGWEVTLASRGIRSSDTNANAPAIEGARHLLLDRDDTAALLKAARGHDLVLDTVAYTPQHADQLVALGDAVGALVVISTGSVYAGTNGDELYLETAVALEEYPDYPDPLTEDLRIVPRPRSGSRTAHSYSPLKAEVERRLLASGLPVSILRPGAIHGRRGGMLREWYFVKRALDRRPFALLAYDGLSRFSTSATANIAELVALSADRPARRVLNAVDEENLTAAQIGETVFRLLGHDADILTFAGPPTSEEVGASPWSVPHPIHLSMAKAKAELGYRQVVSYEDSLADDIRWSLVTVAEAEERGLGWREAFPMLLSRYGGDAWFPYAEEDAYVRRHRTASMWAKAG